MKNEVFSTITAQSEAAAPVVWGWLEPGSSALPHIQLRGNAVALGRGSGLHKSNAGAASPRGGSSRPSDLMEEFSMSATSSACSTQTTPPRQGPCCPQYCRAFLASPGTSPMGVLMPEAANSVTHRLFVYCEKRKPERTPGARVSVLWQTPALFAWQLMCMHGACRAVWSKDLTFVDILDGRVSRLHCILRPGSSAAAMPASPPAGAASGGQQSSDPHF